MYYYGARYYNPRLSIWYGVDPLAVYNPVMETEFYGDGQHNGGVYNSGNLNPYIYCYQRPVVFVDPNGKQVFVTHGTTQTTGNGLFLKESLNEFERIGGNKTVNTAFSWHAPIWNGTMMRAVAATELADHVIANMKKDEPITLVGYSHGGNVDIQAADLIYERTGKKVNLITISTPAYNTPVGEYPDMESPAEKTSINAHIHIIDKNDRVYKYAQGASKFNSSTNHPVSNYTVDNRDVEINGSIDSHTDFPGHKDFSKYLKLIPKIENKK